MSDQPPGQAELANRLFAQTLLPTLEQAFEEQIFGNGVDKAGRVCAGPGEGCRLGGPIGSGAGCRVVNTTA
jgi:hypothetical protein